MENLIDFEIKRAERTMALLKNEVPKETLNFS